MEQSYAEATAQRKKTTGGVVLKVVWIIAIVALLACMIITTWLAILGVAAGVALFWYWPRFDVMWEYVYCDGQLDFDQIFGGEKRKNALRIEIEDADVIAPIDSNRLDGYRHLPKKDFSSQMPDAKIYGIATKIGNSEDKTVILFEPNEKMLDMMALKCPRTVEK
ncbi:MAG: hypothetical protein II915_01885 [Eubacterium sp.]|nr:hypothetical protein [Eubacterium sp.]